jgi:hypothetical protein
VTLETCQGSGAYYRNELLPDVYVENLSENDLTEKPEIRFKENPFPEYD